MEALLWETAEEIILDVAKRFKQIRKRKAISQEKLESLSGVSLGSIKRFETTGQISLISLTKLTMALNCVDELKKLFSNVPYKDIEEILNEK